MSQAVAYEEIALESAGPGGALHWKMVGDAWQALLSQGHFDVRPHGSGFHTWWLYKGPGRAVDLGHHATLGAAFGAARDFLDSEYGGKRAAEEAPTAKEANEERAALRWAEISFDLREDASKFARLIEKVNSTIVASHQGLIVTTNASGRDIEKVLKKHTWKEGYNVSKNAERYDQAAECCNDDNCAHRHPKSVPTSACETRTQELAFDTNGTAIKFVESLKKVSPDAVVTRDGSTVFTDASREDIDRVLSRNKWRLLHHLSKKEAKASEQVNVVHEESPTTPAYLQCSGNPEVYKQWVDFGDKFGPVDDTHKLYRLLATRMQSQDQELFVVVVVDLYGHVRGISEVNRGERSAVNVSVTQIMRVAAMVQGGTAFMVAHCHPTSKAKPSKADRELTKTIERAADPHGDELKFIDHVVIGHGEFYSIKESKMHYETGKCCRR